MSWTHHPEPTKGKLVMRRVLEAIVGIGIVLLLLAYAGRRLCNIAIEQLAELTNTEIQTTSVDFMLNGDVFIENLEVTPKDKTEAKLGSILVAEDVHVRFGLWSMLTLDPQLRDINIKDFVFDVRHDVEDGIWNLGGLRIQAPQGGRGKIPRMQLSRGVLQYTKIGKEKTSVALALPIDFELGPGDEPKSYMYKIATAQRNRYRRSIFKGKWSPGHIEGTGGISSEDIPVFEKIWIVEQMAFDLNYEEDGEFKLRMRATDMVSKEKPEKSVGTYMPSIFSQIAPLGALEWFFRRYQPAGRIDLDIEMRGELKRLTRARLKGKVLCKDVYILDREFPYLIERVRGDVEFSDKHVTLNRLTGLHGDVRFFIDGYCNNFGPNREFDIRMKSNNMRLDEDLSAALSDTQKRLWDMFDPLGIVAIDRRFVRSPEGDYSSTLTVDLIDASAEYELFPYRLQTLNGQLIFEEGKVHLQNLHSRDKEKEVWLSGEVLFAGNNDVAYDVTLKADNIPVDAKLKKALAVKKLHFTRKFNWQYLPDEGQVWMEGRFHKQLQASPAFGLTLYTENVQLQSKLYSLFPRGVVSHIFNRLHPVGAVNFRAKLEQLPDESSPRYHANVDCLGAKVKLKKWPYELHDVLGGVTITKDAIELNGIRCNLRGPMYVEGDNTKLQLDGHLNIENEEFVNGKLNLSLRNMPLNNTLSELLSDSAGSFYRELSPTGRFDANNVTLNLISRNEKGWTMEFDSMFHFKNSSLAKPVKVTDFNGNLRLGGYWQQGEVFHLSNTYVEADSLKVRNTMINDVSANILVEENGDVMEIRDISGACYSGNIFGSAKWNKNAEDGPQYLFDMSFRDIDLAQYVSDSNIPQRVKESNKVQMQGKMSGSLSFQSSVEDFSNKLGRCQLTIRDMEFGKLSPFSQLLQVVRLSEPQDYAFDQMYVDSYIQGDKAVIKKFDIAGRDYAFNGEGELNLNNQMLSMVLTARGKRVATKEPGLLQSLTEAMGRGVVRVDVTGPIYDPQVTTTMPIMDR